jgi:hypothetical protein
MAARGSTSSSPVDIDACFLKKGQIKNFGKMNVVISRSELAIAISSGTNLPTVAVPISLVDGLCTAAALQQFPERQNLSRWRSGLLLQSKKIFRISMRNLLPIGGTNRQVIQERPGLYHRGEWVVG